jgi:hypothetical protein
MSILYYLREMGDSATGNNGKEKDRSKALQMCFGLLPLMMVYSAANLGKDYCCTEMASKTKARLAALIAEHSLVKAFSDASERSTALSLASSDTNQATTPVHKYSNDNSATGSAAPGESYYAAPLIMFTLIMLNLVPAAESSCFAGMRRCCQLSHGVGLGA